MKRIFLIFTTVIFLAIFYSCTPESITDDTQIDLSPKTVCGCNIIIGI